MFRYFTTLVLCVAPLAVRAASSHASGCFDFSRRVAAPLEAPAPLAPDGDVKKISGTLADGRVWASAEGVVNHSTEELFQDLITHRATRAGAAKEMKLKTLGDAKNDLQQTAEFVIKPFPLVTVQWTEHWTYNAVKGSLQNPDTLVVAYEKTDGTSHIEHLCGTLKLEKISSDETRVTLYEEVKATRRSEQDTLGGVTATLRELRELKVATSQPGADEGVKSGSTSDSSNQSRQ